jgi:hypothetical protein
MADDPHPDPSSYNEEAEMNLKPKICTECQCEIVPAGPNSKLCKDCKAAAEAEDSETSRISEIQGQPDPTKTNVRIVGEPSNNLEALALQLLQLSGCKSLSLEYNEFLVQIDRKGSDL